MNFQLEMQAIGRSKSIQAFHLPGSFLNSQFKTDIAVMSQYATLRLKMFCPASFSLPLHFKRSPRTLKAVNFGT